MINEIPSVSAQPKITFGMKSTSILQGERALEKMQRQLELDRVLAKRGKDEVREIIVRDTVPKFVENAKDFMRKLGIKI